MEVPPYPRLRFAPPAVPSPTSWGTDPFKISWRDRRPPTPSPSAHGDKPGPPPAVPSPTSWGTDPFKISWRERLPPTRRLRRRVPSPFAIAQGDKPPPAFSRDRK